MAWQKRGGKKGSGTGIRLTGLFRTKRQGLYVGGVSEDKINELVKLIKLAISKEKEITVFLWKNTKDDNPKLAFSLNVDLAQDRSERPKPKRQIEPDEDDEPEGDDESGNDDPFADD